MVRFPAIRRPGLVTASLATCAFLTLLAPFLFAAVPPLSDYPNHLARYWLIAGGANDPVLSQVFKVDWANAATNLGVDWVVKALAPFAPGLAVGHLALVAAAVLPPLGLLALNIGVFRRGSSWQAIFPIVAWSAPFLMGFLNFQVGLGLALLFAAVEPVARDRLGRFAALPRIAFGAILMVDHLFALLFYALLVAALEFGPEPAAQATWLRLRRATVGAAWCLTPLLVILGSARALPAVTGAGGLSFGSIGTRAVFLLSALVGYDILVELPLALLLAYLGVWLARRGKLEHHAGLMIAAAVLTGLAVVSPVHIGDSSWISARFPIMALLCLLAGLQLSRAAPSRGRIAFALAALALVSVRSAWVAWNWRQMEPDIAAVRRVMADIPYGARVMPMQHRPSALARFGAPAGRYMFNVRDPTFMHYALLAIPLRHARVPTLFALRGKHPIDVLGPWRRCAETEGGELASVNALNRGPRAGDSSYVGRWRQCFDYILVMNADLPDAEGPFHPPAGVTLMADQRFAQLWRVQPSR